MDEILVQYAQKYAKQRHIQIVERLGFGIHGIIFATEGNKESSNLATAIKVHRSRESYLRELSVYQRLTEARISKILGSNVPQLLGYDDETCIIEMTIVSRPYVLDFAGAYLDSFPEFPDSIWSEWEIEKREQFGSLWPQVQDILAALEKLDIYLIDVSPSNVAFEYQAGD